MSERTEKILSNVKTDSSGKWMDVQDVHILLENVLKDCETAVKDTGKQCAFTTHDLGVVMCTLEKCLQSIRDLYK